MNDDNFQEFDRGGFQPVVHNEFLVEQAMWRQGGDENDPKKDVTGSTEMLQRGSTVIHSYREHKYVTEI